MGIKTKYVANNASELAGLLGLSSLDTAELEFRAELNTAIIQKFKTAKMTHAELAKKAQLSRTRLTALLNNNSHGLSTDFMLRVLRALGYRADLKLSKIA
ncbi:MAG TPA: XRE family transcriptional regulator [Turneriella sp.]|nr:XRE family transcriptional regulator [Turneriella sp.]